MKVPVLDALKARRRNAKRAAQFRAGRERLRKTYKLATLSYHDEPQEGRAANAQIAGWLAEGRLEPFEALYAQSERADIMLANATKLHVFQWRRLLAAFDDADGPACDRLTPPFKHWFETTRTPLAAASYASALHDAAYAHRGSRSADEVREDQWARYNARLELGRDALAATAAAGRTSLPWLWAQYDYALQDAGSLDEFNARFRDAWSRDMSNVLICLSHGVRLLPRWLGHDARDLEAFARHATGMTHDRFGEGLYALIYGHGYHIGGHPIGDTLCDRDRLRRGYEDLAARFPSQSILNRFAAGMYFSRDYPTCAAVFRGMSAIVPELWDGATETARIEDALDTFYVVT